MALDLPPLVADDWRRLGDRTDERSLSLATVTAETTVFEHRPTADALERLRSGGDVPARSLFTVDLQITPPCLPSASSRPPPSRWRPRKPANSSSTRSKTTASRSARNARANTSIDRTGLSAISPCSRSRIRPTRTRRSPTMRKRWPTTASERTAVTPLVKPRLLPLSTRKPTSPSGPPPTRT